MNTRETRTPSAPTAPAVLTVQHSAALAYAAIGWPVFPVTPGEKIPAYRNPHPRGSAERATCRGRWAGCGRNGHGVLDATTDPAAIGEWWIRQPYANVGIACGLTDGPEGVREGPDVLDIDVKDGAPGAMSRERLRRAGYLAGALGQVRTPSGGEHLYFDGTRQGNGSIKKAGVDFRSTGGYVLGAGSVVGPVGRDGVPCGPAYRWLSPFRLDGHGTCDWAAIKTFLLPPHLWAPRDPGRVLTTGLGGVVGWLERQTAEGNRNAALHWAVCRALESGHPYHEVEAAMTTAAQRIGLKDDEIGKTIRSAHNRVLFTGRRLDVAQAGAR